MSDWLSVVVIAVLLLVAAFAAMAESVISRMSRVKALHLAQESGGGNKAQRLVRVIENPAPYMNVVLFLMLVAFVSGTAMATSLALKRFDSGGEVFAAIVMTLLIFVFAQVIPKTYTVQRLDSAAFMIATPVYLLGRAFAPVGTLLIAIANAFMALLPGKGLPKGPFITEDEIRHLVDVAEEEEEIEEDERELIHSIFEFGDTVVREVMVPRPDMVTIVADASLDQALETIVKAGYSRIPIYEGDIDNVIGILYAKDLLQRLQDDKRNGVTARSFGRAPTFVPEQKKVAELLREMQESKVHIAIVVDEYGGTAGLVTIEDLIEEIVGEIVDEYDVEEPLFETLDDDSVRVDARLPIDELNELMDVELPDEEWDTVGGLVFGLAGRVPAQGERVKFDSVEFETERVTGRRVQKVLVRKIAPSTDETTEE